MILEMIVSAIINKGGSPSKEALPYLL